MILIFSEVCAVINAKMVKFTHIKHIITSIEIGVNNTIGFHLFPNNRQKCGRLRVWYYHGINLSVPL
ncbi:hypothetical protein COI_1739 [Mannheimia haemolytica serotype A2 str. OVINE]|nr:hypothetical protein COI_1739 [Mannheimia haemolytica serotype A2 str. OVINE]EEY11766.1 hypothetical protein COK_2163 [Mannheimia haemolytica serotype A2 str. BOVINE]